MKFDINQEGVTFDDLNEILFKDDREPVCDEIPDDVFDEILNMEDAND